MLRAAQPLRLPVLQVSHGRMDAPEAVIELFPPKKLTDR
jgi:hypothetical protein